MTEENKTPEQPEQQNQELPPEQVAQFNSVEAGEDPNDVYIPGDRGNTQVVKAEPRPDPQGEKYIAPVLVVLFGILAARRGPLWELSKTEADELARTGGAVLDYYFQLSPSPVGAFLVCAGMVVGPRVALDFQQSKARALAEQKAKQQEAANGDQPEQ